MDQVLDGLHVNTVLCRLVECQACCDRPIPALVEAFASATIVERKYSSSDAIYFMISISAEDWVPFADAAKTAGFDAFSDLFAIDHFTDAPRYEIVLNLVAGRGDGAVEPIEFVFDGIASDEPPRNPKSLVAHNERFTNGHAR